MSYSESLATLVYAAVNSRIDYCNTVLAGAPRTVTDKLQRVLNAAARVVTGTRKFDRDLGQILHEELHWLDVPDRVIFKLAVTFTGVWTAAHHPICRTIVSQSPVLTLGGMHLRSTNRQLLAVPRYRLNTYGRRASSVAGPTVWNSLPDFIRDPTISSDCFRRLLKTYLFARYYSAFSASEVLTITALYKFTYLLTYLSVASPKPETVYPQTSWQLPVQRAAKSANTSNHVVCVLKATAENKMTSVTTHFRKSTTWNNVCIVSVIV